MDVDHRFWHWTGLIAGVAWTVYIVAVLRAAGLESSVDGFCNVLKEWQTLLAGLLALAGVVITVHQINEQIMEQRRQEEDRRNRQNAAARAPLPGALSELVEYTRNTYELLKALHTPQQRILHPAGWSAPAPVQVPRDALSVVHRVIESADLSALPVLAQVPVDFQILDARMRSLAQDVAPGAGTFVTQHTFLGRVADAIRFEILCNGLFEYARGGARTPAVEMTLAELNSRAFFAGFHELNYPGIGAELARRASA